MSPSDRGKSSVRSFVAVVALAALGASPAPTAPAPAPRPAVPLARWNESPARRVVARFFGSLSAAGTGDPSSPEEVRVALFATEGVLWERGSVPLETAWALERIRSLAPTRPEWASTPPFAAVLGGDPGAVSRLSPPDLARLTAAAVADLDAEGIRREVLAWVRSGHPVRPGPAELGRPPMRELLELLRTWGFRNYVVSDGPAEVTRALVEALYDLPPYRVAAPASRLEVRDLAEVPRLAVAGEPAPAASQETRLLAVARQLGMKPMVVAAELENDALLFRWAAGRPGPFLALVFPRVGGPPAVSPLPPGSRGLWTTVFPARTWKDQAPRPAP